MVILAEQYSNKVLKSRLSSAGKAAIAGGVIDAIGVRLDELKDPESMTLGTIEGYQEMSADELYSETYKRALRSIISNLQSELSGII